MAVVYFNTGRKTHKVEIIQKTQQRFFLSKNPFMVNGFIRLELNQASARSQHFSITNRLHSCGERVRNHVCGIEYGKQGSFNWFLLQTHLLFLGVSFTIFHFLFLLFFVIGYRLCLIKIHHMQRRSRANLKITENTRQSLAVDLISIFTKVATKFASDQG